MFSGDDQSSEIDRKEKLPSILQKFQIVGLYVQSAAGHYTGFLYHYQYYLPSK